MYPGAVILSQHLSDMSQIRVAPGLKIQIIHIWCYFNGSFNNDYLAPSLCWRQDNKNIFCHLKFIKYIQLEYRSHKNNFKGPHISSYPGVVVVWKKWNLVLATQMSISILYIFTNCICMYVFLHAHVLRAIPKYFYKIKTII